ncbi:AraC family transcriptional regulator [Listeria kieliensis]|uniref:AraC family transcriptional regulator n=1 Tax=Listeria kieliensis TaxID=1621700 RepID=UPI0014026D43|nr:AraC family transcriptional regulator [Listeria kieliensis]
MIIKSDKEVITINPYIPKIEPGILAKRGPFFYETTELTRKLYLHAYWSGEYLVDVQYSLTRDYMSSFLVFFVKSGELHFDYREQTFTAPAGTLVLLDCKEKNHYFASQNARFQFVHFNGPTAQSFCDALYAQHGSLFSLPPEQNPIPRILDLMESGALHDFEIATCFNELLGRLFERTRLPLEMRSAPSDKYPPEIQAALTFIHSHYYEKITIQRLSHEASLSSYHFSRLFKKHTGESPHQYLLTHRLKQAKRMLLETNLTVEQISTQCGFSSSTHFIKAFASANAGTTPGKFRKVHF